MRYLLDTNVLSDLVRRPQGPVSEQVRRVGENAVMTSIIVAAELRFGAAKRGSKSLTAQLEAILGALEVVPLEPPTDEAYATTRTELETRGAPIGGNDMLIAAHARALGTTLVTDNEREFRRVDGLTIENWLR